MYSCQPYVCLAARRLPEHGCSDNSTFSGGHPCLVHEVVVPCCQTYVSLVAVHMAWWTLRCCKVSTAFAFHSHGCVTWGCTDSQLKQVVATHTYTILHILMSTADHACAKATGSEVALVVTTPLSLIKLPLSSLPGSCEGLQGHVRGPCLACQGHWRACRDVCEGPFV